ncbi:MAG: C-GCAxxG-C-C family protein [Lentimicrobium sp.]|jgi:C_GCAxxG_C_C family probable redox protein|nr:C-GCAxxG-C-C family protein [Lentimicrobium sp.]
MTPSDISKGSPDQALNAFKSGYNCAQSVVKAYAEVFGFDEDQALALSSGFGGGMGGMQGACGAVTGAYMVLGMFCAAKYKDNHERKACSGAFVREFHRQFTAMHQTDECRVLLCQDSSVKAGERAKLHLSVCDGYIVDAVEIINGLLEAY